MYFSKILIAAFIVAIFASSITSLYEEEFVTPIILSAEVYEAPDADSNHETESWAPKEGAERSLFTLSANFLVSFAFATLLICTMLAKGDIKLKQGVLWGAAGYLCFFIAPALGLAPEIPGMEAAQLEARQAWWWVTVLLTAVGLWIFVFSQLHFKIIGLLLIIAPHLYGAPKLETHGFANTDPEAVTALSNLWHEFILQTSLANGLLWLLIGSSSTYFVVKFIESTETET